MNKMWTPLYSIAYELWLFIHCSRSHLYRSIGKTKSGISNHGMTSGFVVWKYGCRNRLWRIGQQVGNRHHPWWRGKKSHRTRPSEANDASLSDFFIFNFLATFSFFHSPRPTFLSSLLPRPSFFPRPALSRLFRIRKSRFWRKQITDQRTNQRQTDKASYRDADASKSGPLR